jgi:hypothetical protein
MVLSYEWIQTYIIVICKCAGTLCAGTLCARESERNGASYSDTVWRPEFFFFFFLERKYN